MAEKTFCVICDRDAEIVKVIPHGDYEEQILSCQHFARRLSYLRKKEKRKLPYIRTNPYHGCGHGRMAAMQGADPITMSQMMFGKGDH